MNPNHLIILSLASIISFSSFIGCSKPAETIQKSSSNVVSQKIIEKKSSDLSKSASPEVSEAKVLAEPASPKSTEKAEQEISKNKIAEPVSASTASSSTEFEEMNILDEKDRYSPEGKIDPFAPIFKNEPKPPVVEQSPEVPIIPRGPLEKVDLSQLKLVGIVCAQSGNKALVEEASGKGYIIAKGTRIGNRLGKVAEILTDRVLVEEESANVLGKVTICQRELKLQKPAGEE